MVSEMIITDTSYYQGDECPGRPSEFRLATLLSEEADSLIFKTNEGRALAIEMGYINFWIWGDPNPKISNNNTQAEYKQTEKLLNRTFSDLIIASSDAGNIQKIYIAQNYGLVGFVKNDTIYELKK